MGKLLAVAIGGASGSLGRYFIAIITERLTHTNFPLATLTANLTGSLLIGFFWSYFDKLHISNEFRLFIFTGFLGGFTTFSTFTRESLQFIRAGEPYHAIVYILVSNILGLALVGAGIYLCQKFVRF